MSDRTRVLVWLVALSLGLGSLLSEFHATAAPAAPVGSPQAGSSQEGAGPKVTTLGWEQAIRTGLSNHPMVRFAQYGVQESQAVTKQLESVNYPQVTGIFANSGGNTRVLANLGISGSLPKPTNYLTTPGARVDLLITDFGHTAHRILANRALSASAEKQVLSVQALVILNVEQAYLNALKQQRIVEVAREMLKERELIRTQAEVLYRHKLRSKLDLEYATVEATRAELALVKAENDLNIAYATLTNAMGLSEGQTYVLEPVAVDIKPSDPIETLFEHALANRPELLGSRDRVQAAEEAKKAARALRFGKVDAIGTLAYTWWKDLEFEVKGSPKNPGKQLGWWGAAVASSVPLYTGGRISGRIEEAEARQGEQQAAARSLANEVVLQVAKAYWSRLTAEEQIKVARDKVAFAKEALTLARERYQAGLGSILDVTTATGDLLSAEVGLADAQYSYRTSDAALAFATGTEVTLFSPSGSAKPEGH